MRQDAARAQEPAEKQRLREAIDVANVPTLLMVLVQLTGDLRWLEEPYRPTRSRGLEDNDTGGLDPAVQGEIKDAAAEAILAHRDGTPAALPAPDDELLVHLMSVCMGEQVPPDYAPIIREEIRMAHLRLVDGHQGALSEAAPSRWMADASDAPANGDRMSAIIVGAGISGVGAAIHLDRAGIDYTIVEKHHDVGGVWLENRYPGCGVDTPSHIYTYSFAPNDWTHYFALRDEIAAYIRRIADDFSVRPQIRFHTEALGAEWDEAKQRWTVHTRTADGREEELSADFLITAVGAFNKPKVPRLEGQERYGGVTVHTARWPEDGVELEGKQVAVIGNGASAMQVVPEIADRVGQLTVFQRSPQWAVPFEKFRKEIPEGVRYLLDHEPLYYAWYRLRLAWAYNDKVHPSLQKDPSWPHPERSLNAINDGHREYFTRHIMNELGDRQDLLDRVLPDYPPFGKRILLDNGWFRTLTKPNVELIDSGVHALTAQGLVTDDGREVQADVIIYATGFDVVHFLAPMRVEGRDGRVLEEEWDGDDARAYLGGAVPGFPNFFCLYGPNTQFGHGGSLITVLERQIHLLMGLLARMRRDHIGAIEVREDVYDAYNARVDAAHEQMVWTHPGMSTYYRNSRGRVVVNNPFKIVDYWKLTEAVNPADFVMESRGVLAG